MFVLQPFLQPDLGLMMFKPGKSLLSEIIKESHGNRFLVMPLPAQLVGEPSGRLTKVISHAAVETLIGDARLNAFFLRSEVQKRLGDDFLSWVKRIPHCQLSDGEYCDKNLTVFQPAGGGAIRLCWHHDNVERSNQTDNAQSIALKNLSIWAFERIRSQLKLPHDRALSFPEIGWWAVTKQLTHYMPQELLTVLFGNNPQSRSFMFGGKKDTDNRYVPDERERMANYIKPIKQFIIDPEPPAMFMARPKEVTWKSEAYLKFVRSLPCVITGKTTDIVAHHLIGHGEGKMGGKCHDLFTMPLHVDEHRKFHDDPKGWEELHGSQLIYLKRTIGMALSRSACR